MSPMYKHTHINENCIGMHCYCCLCTRVLNVGDSNNVTDVSCCVMSWWKALSSEQAMNYLLRINYTTGNSEIEYPAPKLALLDCNSNYNGHVVYEIT